MRYNATISYKNKSVTIKVTNKLLEGKHELPDFLFKVRKLKGLTIKQLHLHLDYNSDECQMYEEGKKDITKAYLRAFANGFGLPVKLSVIGRDLEKDRKAVFVSRLKELRIKENLPQEVIAFEIGVARSTYACYESGKNEPDIATLIKIADIYGISLDYLVGRYGE